MKKLSVVLMLMLGLSHWSKAQDYKYHSLFIYNFSRYIEWPDTQSSGDFVICVVGDEQAYQDMVAFSQKKKTVKNRNLVIKKCKTLQEVSKSNIVFVTKSSSVAWRDVEQKLRDSGTLLITEQRGIAKSGAHINFVKTSESKIGFEINTASTEEAGLRVASSLAMLAYKTY